MSAKVALITGASSGIGAACAALLSKQGFRVYGSSRNGDFQPAGYQPLQMDVTDDGSVERAIAHVMKEAGAIDVLVNNAGCGIAGAVEETSTQEALRQMDVNFMGAFRVTRAVLPVMRSQRSGVIVNISSLGGLFGLPFQSFYSASKFALEGWTESLSHEVAPFGIRVVLVEPGDIKTGFTASRVLVAAHNSSSAYADRFSKCMRIVEKEEGQGVRPELVARLVLRIATGKARGPRHTCGHMLQRITVPLKRLLPSGLFARIIGSFYGM